jgi:hypothetical protein
MIPNGYPTGTHQISQEKNDTRHFIKWNAHACGHFVFQNASRDVTLCKCSKSFFKSFLISMLSYHIIIEFFIQLKK